MTQRARKPFSRATLYSSAVVFILFGAMGFFSIPAFSTLLLGPSWLGAGEAAISASRPDRAKGARHLKRRPRGEPSGRQAQVVQVEEAKLSTLRTGAGGSNLNHHIRSQVSGLSQCRGEVCAGWRSAPRREATGSHKEKVEQSANNGYRSQSRRGRNPRGVRFISRAIREPDSEPVASATFKKPRF
jgi:hypothetical protein